MGRCRNWELIIYPESCDIDLLKEKLSDMQINFYLDIFLNDKDAVLS